MTSFMDLAQSIQMALKAIQMYTSAHPRPQAALQALAEAIGQWLQAQPSLHIAASHQKLFVDGSPLETQSIHTTTLARQLGERQIAGFILHRGVPATELLELLQILSLKPAKIEERGGVAKILDSLDLQFITLSQTMYKEVREGEGGEEDHGGSTSGTSEDPAQRLATLIQQWKDQLEASIPPFREGALPSPANLSHLEGLARESGFGEDFPSELQLGVLRRALQELPAPSRASVLLGSGTLPSAPSGLKLGLEALAPELLAQTFAELFGQNTAGSGLKDMLLASLRMSSGSHPLMKRLAEQFLAAGLDPSLIQDALRQQEWDQLDLDHKIRMAMEGNRFWELTLEQRLGFLRELLEQHRLEPFLQFLERVLDIYTSEDPLFREPAAQTLAGVSHWIETPGLPVEAEGTMLQALTANFGWEPVVHIHRQTEEALSSFLQAMTARKEFIPIQSLMQELTNLMVFLEEKQDWREHALARLQKILTTSESLQAVVDVLYQEDLESTLASIRPYLQYLGPAIADALVQALGDESDRKRRARLLEVIRDLGPAMIPALQTGLQGGPWYLTRNTLNILSELGDVSLLDQVAPCLAHSDGRVRRAAVRAVWKLGGASAAQPLLALFPGTDPETQVEILFGLGQVKAIQAVPLLSEFALSSANPERLRIKAVETLGQIGNPGSIQTLLELLQRKGRIFTSAQPTEIRVASARAILATRAPQALSSLRDLIAREPGNKDKDALQRVLSIS